MAASASRFVLPYQTVIDAAGVPIPGAQLFFYISGTSTPQNTYSDSALTVPNSNPVVADAGGRFGNIFMLPVFYKVVLTDFLGNQIWTADPVSGSGGGSGGQNTLRKVVDSTTVLSSDQILEVDATAGDITVTYPLALGTLTVVQPVRIVRIDTSANNVFIVNDATPLVPQGGLPIPANGANMQSALVYSNGVALRIT